MIKMPFMRKLKYVIFSLTTALVLAPVHANQYAPNSYNNNSHSGSGMGMGMGSGSGAGPGYYGRPDYGYYGRPDYGYQRPPRPPMQPYYQQPFYAPQGHMQMPAVPNSTPAVGDAPNQGLMVSIQGMAFQPTNLTVNVGQTVTWVNKDSAPHTVTSSDGGPLDSGTLNSSASYQMTFDKAGTYNYYCKFHPGMRATVTVK
jgi:plastocyanin